MDHVACQDAVSIIDRPAMLEGRFRRDTLRVTTACFHTYAFDRQSSEAAVGGHPAITWDGNESYSIVVGGRAVAQSSSSRSNGEAAELWIETDPAHRRRGYAVHLARTWARDVLQAGKIAFYSHYRQNRASAALARRLGVTPIFDIVAINLEGVA